MELRISNTRIGFAHGLFTASAMEEGQIKKYGADFVVQDDSKVEKKVDGKWVPTTLAAAQEAVVVEAFKGNKDKALDWFGDLEARQKAIRDGSKRKTKSGDVYEGYEGRKYITAKNKSRPTILNAAKEPITEEDGLIYSGCYVTVLLDLYVNLQPGKKGVFAGLKGVQHLPREADAWGGGGKASADDFEDATEGAGAEDFA